jgi:RND family efflux transporter MFP subunit
MAAAQANYARLKEAAQTPGAISANELEQSERSVDAARAAVQASAASVKAAEASVQAIRDLEAYLNVAAPFSGTVTERYVHPGALASATAGPLLRIEDTSRLRLVVALPEAEAGAIVPRASVKFSVPAFPERVFQATVARISRSLDPKTRTMAVELDTPNPGGLLAPGMYPEVSWPVRRRGAMLVPATAVVTTTERTFVIRAENGVAEWVSVRKGAPAGDQVEVYGDLKEGDAVVKRGSDEIRQGTRINTKAAS